MSPEETTAHIKSELRAFVGLSYEKLAQQWVVAQARAGTPSSKDACSHFLTPFVAGQQVSVSQDGMQKYP